MPIGAIVAGGLGAIGSIGGSLISSGASSKAAATQANAAQAALNQQKQMFGVAQNALDPYINAGASALPSLNALLTPGPSQTSMLSQLPGFQFQSQWGDIAATNQLTAEGLGGSAGPLGKALSDYNQGLAGTYFTNYANLLQQYANMGLGAGSALAGNATNTGSAIAQTQQNQGNALASGILGSGNALAGGLTGAAGSATNALLLNSLLGGGNAANAGIYGAPNGLAGPSSAFEGI